jgi:hypothetical protein
MRASKVVVEVRNEKPKRFERALVYAGLEHVGIRTAGYYASRLCDFATIRPECKINEVLQDYRYVFKSPALKPMPEHLRPDGRIEGQEFDQCRILVGTICDPAELRICRLGAERSMRLRSVRR